MSYKNLIEAVKHRENKSDLYNLKNSFNMSSKSSIMIPIAVIEIVGPTIDSIEEKEKYYKFASILASIKLNGRFANYNDYTDFGKNLLIYDKRNINDLGLKYLKTIGGVSQINFLSQLVNWVDSFNKENIEINPYDLGEAIFGDKKTWKNSREKWAMTYFRN